MLWDSDWLVEAEVLVDVLAETGPLVDVEADMEVDALIDSLPDVDALAEPAAAESLVVADVETDSGADDALVDSDDDAADSLAARGAADSLDSLGAVDWLVDAGAADWLVLWEVDSVVDSVADSLVAAPLPGVSTVLPSVARVFRLAAVTSYETGVSSDMI